MKKAIKQVLGLSAVAAAFFLGSAHAEVVTVSGKHSVWAAGLTSGSATVGSELIQEDMLPTLVSVYAGGTLTFSVSGGANNAGGDSYADPDGGSTSWTSASYAPENGISNVTAPLNSLVAVFLGPAGSSRDAAPSALDFSPTGNVAGGLDYVSLSPLLQQVFFVGDGLTSLGGLQQVIVPVGATRLYLGTMDGWGWSNNDGAMTVNVTENAGAIPEPSSAALLGVGSLALAACQRRTKKRGANLSAA